MPAIPGPSVAEGYRAAMNFDLFDHLPGWMGGNSGAAAMPAIPGPSVAEGYRAAMNFDLFDHLPGWMGGNSGAAAMPAIPGPSVAEGYRAAMNFDLFDHLPGWMGGNSGAAAMPAIPGPSVAANVYQEMNGQESGAAESELLRQLSYEMNSYHDAGDTAYQEAGDTVNNNNVSITYNDRRGGGGRPDMDMVADDLLDAMNRRYAGD